MMGGKAVSFALQSHHEEVCCHKLDTHLHQRKLFTTKLVGLVLGPHWSDAKAVTLVPATPCNQVALQCGAETLTFTLAPAGLYGGLVRGGGSPDDNSPFELEPGKKGALVRFLEGEGAGPAEPYVKLQIPHGVPQHLVVLRCELAGPGAVAIATASERFTLCRKIGDAYDPATREHRKRKDGAFVTGTRKYTHRKDAAKRPTALTVGSRDLSAAGGPAAEAVTVAAAAAVAAAAVTPAPWDTDLLSPCLAEWLLPKSKSVDEFFAAWQELDAAEGGNPDGDDALVPFLDGWAGPAPHAAFGLPELDMPPLWPAVDAELSWCF